MRLGITFYHFDRRLVLDNIHGEAVLNFQEGLIKKAAIEQNGYKGEH